jgi:hypothetical protein
MIKICVKEVDVIYDRFHLITLMVYFYGILLILMLQ